MSLGLLDATEEQKIPYGDFNSLGRRKKCLINLVTVHKATCS